MNTWRKARKNGMDQREIRHSKKERIPARLLKVPGMEKKNERQKAGR